MRRSRIGARRGTIMLAAIIVLSLLTIGVATTVTASGDDARMSALRGDSARAFYAAESGVHIAMRALLDDPSDPSTGTLTLASGSVIRFVESFGAESQNPSTAVIEGSYGVAVRRIQIDVD